MSATTHEWTMTVSRGTIVDLIAALQAACDLVVVEDERFSRRLSREECVDAIGVLADKFRISLLGPSPEDDDAYRTDPTLVELSARCSEFEAEMIASCMQSRVRGAETSREARGEGRPISEAP